MQKNPQFSWFSWQNAIILVLSLLAITGLGYSYQQVRIAREDTPPAVRILNWLYADATVVITGCVDNAGTYFVELYTVNEITFVNDGGRPVALTKVNLLQEDRGFVVRLYPPQSFSLDEREAKDLAFDGYHGAVYNDDGEMVMVPVSTAAEELPLNIGGGLSEKRLFQGEQLVPFKTAEDAHRFIERLKENPNEHQLTWFFQFSDGSAQVWDKPFLGTAISPRLSSDSEFPPCPSVTSIGEIHF